MRRHKHEEHANHEAWAIPYADLMTLLLAFFVVMYAVSVVNEGKFRVMSESMIEAFNGSSHAIAPLPPTQVRPHNISPSIAAPAGQAGSSVVPVAVPIPPHPVAMQGGHGRDIASQVVQPAKLERIESEVRKALQALIDRKQVTVRNNGHWLEIEIRTDILFPSGVAQLSTSAQGVLHALAGVLAGFGNALRIEGFTDDVPINTALYPSNWELSAARAGSVARLFVDSGIAPDRLGIIGWGEVHPVADNGTEVGRNENRRVLVVVMGEGSAPQRERSGVRELDRQPGIASLPTPGVLPTVQVVEPQRPAPEAGAAKNVPQAAAPAAADASAAAGFSGSAGDSVRRTGAMP
ncbi:flagellar motor protein MotD [Rhodanobacter sp. PCA2]|uniref:flagellar motor protein MotD n=1 Tax=Rhodanobacter sp. PCA2 TaxID=2006117 RepID=UPI0015E732EE|nr:flagellar motor protein MotD [Rhodanobacter sp. PCA2]MBA2077216.1 flagellar motor protein MotB [Rhodanobacter sp. PCA2]